MGGENFKIPHPKLFMKEVKYLTIRNNEYNLN